MNDDGKVILSVRAENDVEWDIIQKLMFCLGYGWGKFNKSLKPKFPNRNYLDIWSHGLITHSADGDDINLSLEEFIDHIEITDLEFKNKKHE